jgi:hypothetical protein
MGHVLALALPLADAAEEGRRVIIGMLSTGLVFILVIALGELTTYWGKRRRERRRQRRAAY